MKSLIKEGEGIFYTVIDSWESSNQKRILFEHTPSDHAENTKPTSGEFFARNTDEALKKLTNWLEFENEQARESVKLNLLNSFHN